MTLAEKLAWLQANTNNLSIHVNEHRVYYEDIATYAKRQGYGDRTHYPRGLLRPPDFAALARRDGACVPARSDRHHPGATHGASDRQRPGRPRMTLATDAYIYPRATGVVVLYADPRGPYPELVTEVYDERRDAKTYAGVLPVVAHPPCGPWGPMRHLNQKQDPSCGPHAVEVVRRNGGVLEHPKGSTLFRHCGMPHPGELPDAWGGVTFEVAQVDWGHVARKRTWIYVVGAPPGSIPSNPPPREPTHWCSGVHTPGARGKPPPGIKIASAQQRRRTPVAFARFLIAIAERCSHPIGTP